MSLFTGCVRPCEARGQRALFHHFAMVEQPAGRDGSRAQTASFKAPVAIVEMEDGQVELVRADLIRFTDSDELFNKVFGKDGQNDI